VTASFITFRQLIQTTLTAGITAYTFYAGTPPNGNSVPDSTPVGFVWVEKSEMDSANKLLEEITVGVRMYPIWSQRLDEDQPGNDPTLLEQVGSDLQTTLQPAQYGSDPWYFDVVSIVFDNDNQWVEATIVGVRWNDAAVS
jgi:hypothetical protein